MKYKTLLAFLILICLLIIVGVYYLPPRSLVEEVSEDSYKKMTFKVSFGDYGTLKSPPADFFEETFKKDLDEEKLGERRNEFLVGPSISQKVEENITQENPSLHPRIISYKTGKKLNEYLLEEPKYWISKGLFSLKLWKQKKENLGDQKCSVTTDIFSSDHVLTSMAKAKNNPTATKIRKFIRANYKKLIAPCEEYESSHIYSSMVMDNPDVSTLPDSILSKISEKVVELAKEELKRAKETLKRLKSGELSDSKYDESLAERNIQTKRQRLEKFSQYE